MRVVWYHTDMPFGGAEMVTISIIKGLIDTNSLIHPMILTSNLTADLPGIEIHTLDKNLTPHNAEGRNAIIAKLRDLRADVYVQPQDSSPGWLTELRKAMPTLKIIYHMHSIPFWQVTHKTSGKIVKQLREKLFHSYTKRYLRRFQADYAASDQWVTLCDKYTANMRSILGQRVTTMYNPIELDKYTPLRHAAKQKEVLCMSRLTRRDKRLDRMLKIWEKVHMYFPDWKLKIVGSGEDELPLKGMAKRLRLSNIEFCGYSNTPTEHYKTASILCLTSDIEGWGLVIIEALASGVRPLVMNCSDGISEIVENTGIRSVGAGDINAFTKELRNMMNEELQVPPLPEFLQTLDYTNIATQWQELFKNLANREVACD